MVYVLEVAPEMLLKVPPDVVDFCHWYVVVTEVPEIVAAAVKLEATLVVPVIDREEIDGATWVLKVIDVRLESEYFVCEPMEFVTETL